MDWTVHSLHHVTLGHRKVIVFLLSWNKFPTKINEEIRRHSTEFGNRLTYRGVLVMPYPENLKDAAEEVMQKSWPQEIRARLQKELYPFLLIIDRNFEDFDPTKDRYAFVWFSDFKDNEDKVWEVFGAIAQQVETEQDVFAYLKEVSSEEQKGKFKDRLAGFSKYVDVKIPIIPGVVSVNASAIWAKAMGGAKSA